jgi:hypothetical protein
LYQAPHRAALAKLCSLAIGTKIRAAGAAQQAGLCTGVKLGTGALEDFAGGFGWAGTGVAAAGGGLGVAAFTAVWHEGDSAET